MTRLALISDTHVPERSTGLPAGCLGAFEGCDLVLHAGDVGALSVLDDLSAIAPVIAVRGNDHWTESADTLPLEQVVAVAGVRILLWHGHFEDRSDELAWRHAAGWDDIFDRISHRAAARGASIVITGHSHIPWSVTHRDVLLVNPGAIAPGNAFLAQSLRSVAVLDIVPGHAPTVRHVDVDTGAAFAFSFEPEAAFGDVAARVQRSILAPELRGMRRDLERLYRRDAGFRTRWQELAHHVWSGGADRMSVADARAALEAGGAEAHAFAHALAPLEAERA